jgi:hypothetical protein
LSCHSVGTMATTNRLVVKDLIHCQIMGLTSPVEVSESRSDHQVILNDEIAAGSIQSQFRKCLRNTYTKVPLRGIPIRGVLAVVPVARPENKPAKMCASDSIRFKRSLEYRRCTKKVNPRTHLKPLRGQSYYHTSVLSSRPSYLGSKKFFYHANVYGLTNKSSCNIHPANNVCANKPLFPGQC